MIPFNTPPFVGTEEKNLAEAIKSNKLSGDGPFTKKCHNWFEKRFNSPLVLLTPSCTAALEMAAILINIKAGDEVIMPSYTFVSTANAFVLRGAKIVFVDIRPDTMNIDEKKIEAAITNKTKAIVPVHYAGVSCEMDTIMALAEKYKLWVIEDAAQGVMSTYKGKALGAIGHIGCFSFHETKNYTAGGEGGAILVQDKSLIERAEIIREKGTDRSKFIKGQVDKYSWVDIGSSFLPSELQAAYLFAQLESADKINENRLETWGLYNLGLSELKEKGQLNLPTITANCEHNAHMYYVKCKDISERSRLMDFLKENDILSVFHYIPLHSSKAGEIYSHFSGIDVHTTAESEKLLRLPMYYNLELTSVKKIINVICSFYS
jgi:dTDP-4-amino-4,6-dideoxygalactose transaminase